MSRFWPAAVFLLAALVAMAVLTPLRMALVWIKADALGLSAAGVEGGVWDGRLVDARLAGAPLGDVSVGLNPVALIGGAVRLEVRGEASAPVRRATLIRRGSTVRIEALEADPEAGLVLQAAGFRPDGDGWTGEAF